MRTEISRTYTCGFFLSEQEFRRLSQAVIAHAEKASGPTDYLVTFKTILKDGSIIETPTIDDIFSIENAGAKSIAQLHLAAKATSTDKKWTIDIGYRDAAASPNSWTSVTLNIVGDSRDWSFVGASDLEERIRRTKIISWDALFGSKWSAIFVMLVFVLIALLLGSAYQPGKDSHLILQHRYKAGEFKDPIQAMIALEEIHNNRSVYSMLLPTIVSVLPLILFFAAAKIIPIITPSYNCYWGDYITLFDKRKQRRTIIWTVVVLGLVVSVVAAVITKKLGF